MQKFKYKLAENTIEKKEVLRLSKWLLKDERLTMGNKTKLFQKNFSNFFKSKKISFCKFRIISKFINCSISIRIWLLKK